MLLSITTTYQPATDLGYLLHKHPGKLQTVELAFGQAQVFYPEATEERCTACLMLDINPVAMVRQQRHGIPALAFDYVNDRPYTANSLLSTALAKAFGSALNGRCKDRPELVNQPLPLEARVYSLKAGTDAALIEKLFGPLEYTIEVEPVALDPAFPAWGNSRYVNLTLTHTLPLQRLLSHLYVLIPVLDQDRHYWVSKNEVEVLLAKGQGWLEGHPEHEWIVKRYLRYLKQLTTEALYRLRLGVEERSGEELLEAAAGTQPEVAIAVPKVRLHDLRLQRAAELLKATGAASVLDMGCGEGRLLKLLLREGQFRRLTGMDVATGPLKIAFENLHMEGATPAQRDRLKLFQGSALYKDERLKSYDAAALIEVIEHLEEDRLPALEQVVFGYAHPAAVVVSTPNAEYNRIYNMEEDTFRHSDHRFEWNRAQFQDWCDRVAERFGYTYALHFVGDEMPEVGQPAQMAVFHSTQPSPAA